MELAKSYLNPMDPQENNCCSGFGQLPPKLSFKARQLASHRRSKSEQQSNAFPLLNSDQRVKNSPSRLSKTLPEVLVKNRIHRASNSLPGEGTSKLIKDQHLVGSRPALRSRRGFRESVNIATNADLSRIYIEGGQWWELSPCKYRVKPTNFERRRFYFNDSNTFDQLRRMEGSSNSLSIHHYISTNTHSVHVADNVKHDGLNRDEDLYQPNSCWVAALSKDCESKFILHDKEAQYPVTKKGPSLSHTKQSSSLQAVWKYSRSRSGIRKLIHSPPLVNPVFAVDFNQLTSSDRYHLTDTAATKDLAHSNVADLSRFQKPDVQPQAIKSSLRDKTRSMRLPVPKIYIDGSALNEATPPTGPIVKGEHLLTLTCEWIKLFEGLQNTVPQAVPSSSEYLSVMDSSRFFQQSKNRSDNHTKNDTSTNHNVSPSQNVLGTFNRTETNAHSNFQRGDSYLNDSQFAAQVNLQFPGGPMSKTPSAMKGPSRSLFKAKQTDPSEKPPNLFPDLVIFGRHLQSLCGSSLLAGQEEERKKLKEVAQSGRLIIIMGVCLQ